MAGGGLFPSVGEALADLLHELGRDVVVLAKARVREVLKLAATEPKPTKAPKPKVEALVLTEGKDGVYRRSQ